MLNKFLETNDSGSVLVVRWWALQGWCQGRSQPHLPGWARVPLSSFYPQILINFSYFSSNLTYFLPHFGPPGGRVAHPGRPWLRHWVMFQILRVPAYLKRLIVLSILTPFIKNQLKHDAKKKTKKQKKTKSDTDVSRGATCIWSWISSA